MELRTRRIGTRTKKGQGTRPFSCGQQLYGVTPQDALGIKSRLIGAFSHPTFRFRSSLQKSYDIFRVIGSWWKCFLQTIM
jgi:hypothetical protein